MTKTGTRKISCRFLLYEGIFGSAEFANELHIDTGKNYVIMICE